MKGGKSILAKINLKYCFALALSLTSFRLRIVGTYLSNSASPGSLIFTESLEEFVRAGSSLEGGSVEV